MTEWEYFYVVDAKKEMITTDPKIHKERLNKLGKDGWELVSVIFNQTGEVEKLYFKRQIS